jgi:hypothetical protein
MKRGLVRYLLSSVMLAGGIALCSCASILSPVAPVVTADACKALATCGECISNTACGWCGASCLGAAGDRKDTPATCAGGWYWQVGSCPAMPAPPKAALEASPRRVATASTSSTDL